MDALRTRVTTWLLIALRWWLRVLGDVEAWLDPPVIVPAVMREATPVEVTARLWVTWAQTTYPQQSGEYKRHKVLAKLMKTFPDARQRDLGMAIETAVQKECV